MWSKLCLSGSEDDPLFCSYLVYCTYTCEYLNKVHIKGVGLTSNSWPCGSGASVIYLEGVSKVGVDGDLTGVD